MSEPSPERRLHGSVARTPVRGRLRYGIPAAELEKYDDDGITVVRFASKVRVYDGVTHGQLDQFFTYYRGEMPGMTKKS